MTEEKLESIEEMKERFAIMVEDGDISKQEARIYVLNHATSLLRAKSIMIGLFEEENENRETA